MHTLQGSGKSLIFVVFSTQNLLYFLQRAAKIRVFFYKKNPFLGLYEQENRNFENKYVIIDYKGSANVT